MVTLTVVRSSFGESFLKKMHLSAFGKSKLKKKEAMAGVAATRGPVDKILFNGAKARAA